MSSILTQLKSSVVLVGINRFLWRHFEPQLGVILFLYIQRIKGFSVPDTPHFDSDETTAWFREKLMSAKSYVEFGSGGSTYLAAQLKKPFAAVDSDRYFLDAVKRKITRDGLLAEESQTFIHADIGLTKLWGKPLRIGRPSRSRLESFARYSDLPIPAVPHGGLPDLILVDGRFRVACALKAARTLEARHDWTIMVDDYMGRPEYASLEKYLKLDRYVGRAAVFTGLLPAGAGALDAAIREFEHEPA